MNPKTFMDCFAWLEKFHDRRMPAAARERYLEAFKTEHDDVFCQAMIIHDEKTRPGNFPTIERLRSLCVDARERAVEKKKKAEPRRPFTAPPEPMRRNTERGEKWLKGILEICEGKMTAEELIAKMARPVEETRSV